jgi:hypothetical protein
LILSAVDQQPSRAGFDAYNKLIYRITDDNMIGVSKGYGRSN